MSSDGMIHFHIFSYLCAKPQTYKVNFWNSPIVGQNNNNSILFY